MPYANAAVTTDSTAPHRKNAALRSASQSPYQQRTTDRENPAQQLIKQAVDYLIQQLEAGKSETLTAYLGAMARFHQYSFGNILAIARQRPTATRVAGFNTWKEFGRFVVEVDRAYPRSRGSLLRQRNWSRPCPFVGEAVSRAAESRTFGVLQGGLQRRAEADTHSATATPPPILD